MKKLIEEYRNHGKVGLAGLGAGRCRKAAARYTNEGESQSDLIQPRSWRTRPDPFEEVWPQMTERLADAREL